MNKNRYRVVYNKARQIFMAVAENVKSQTKNSGQSTASSTVIEQSQSFHQLWQVKCLVASMSLWMPLAPVYAQIQPDNSANAGNRPVIGVGQNGQGQNVPVVNIQTPTNGVSHNIYKQMDVLPEGVVLNNSRTGANSVLVGTVGANPFLAQGEARIILNEVNSNIATRFEGNLEVAGQRADVIIANPAGINIQGGGFINANKAILTTGKPQLNADGSIQQFIVDQGKITVSAKSGSSLGLGGNNNNADYVDIYARALELNAQLYANKDLQAITGANNISADLQQVSSRTGAGTTPTLAIDVKNLGGMYANNIYLLGNEKGLGVSNAGTIRAVNNLVVTSAGKIEHTGSLESTSNTQGLVSLQTTQTGDNGNINSSGQISSYDNISINAANDINLTGKQIIAYNSPKLIPEMYISAAGDINIQNAKINNYGPIFTWMPEETLKQLVLLKLEQIIRSI
ncbi:filamentous hemagglutinin N-terminal domain-containing protein [Acinetobacter sp. UGAL515B_02]|nr:MULTISPECIES: filamentous hemagglutinin N-terminal domain-containing protein [Acinetobacter]WON80961.1 filamentous hemagglutinin N-terminal domain-containing protein [Acinetobacter sp. UGAL515B_02]